MEDNAEPVFTCPCGKTFKRKHPYERHMDVAHSSRECHKCEVCSKTFGNHNTLTMHMSVHQETKATFANIKSSERTLRSGKRVKATLASEPPEEQGISDEDQAKENLEPNQTAKDSVSSHSEESSIVSRDSIQIPATSTTEVFTITQSKAQSSDTNNKLSEVVASKTITITVKSKTEPEPVPPKPIIDMNQVNGRIIIKTELPEELPMDYQYSSPEAIPLMSQLNGSLPAFDSSDADIDDDYDDDLSEEERNVRKSTRLQGKTPGWKSWLDHDDQWLSGGGGDKNNRKRRIPRIKQEVSELETLTQLSSCTSLPKLEPEELSDMDVSSSYITKKQGKAGKMVLLCNICGKDFPGEKYLSMHMALHRASGQPDNLPQVVMDMEDDPPVKRTKSNNNSQWTCKICDKTFAQNSNYKNHIRTHSDERPFVCDICCIGFKERYHLKKHQLFKHSTELKEECRVCGKRFKDSTAVRAHERIHSDVRPYACRRCGKTFKTSECLWHHENRSKTCGQALWGSTNPPARFKRGRQPSMKKESKKAEPQPKPPAIPTPAPVPTARPQQRVSLMPVTIPTHTSLQIPVTVQDLANQSTLRVQVDAPPPKPPVDYHPDSPLCNVMRTCVDPPLSVVKVEPEMALPDYELTAMTSDESFDSGPDSERELDDFDDKDLSPITSGNLSDQSSTKSASSGDGKKKYTCEKCGKQFVSSAAYDKHMITHSEARPYKCHLCDIGFKLKVHLKKHNLYRHSDEYPCECSICGKKFKDSSAVRLHERIHSTDRPFKCECGKSFKTRENLWGHRHRGPCEKAVKDGSLLGISRPEDFILAQQSGYANLANVSAHAHITNNQIIAQAMVADNKVTAHATINDNGELLLATASILGPAYSAQANVDGTHLTARSKMDDQEVISQYPANGHVDSAKVPVLTGRVCDPKVSQALPVNPSQGSVPTARVAPFKRERSPEPSGQKLPLCLSEKSILPPFETSFAPTIRSALARSPIRGPAAVTFMDKKGLSIADRCPTIQKCLMQGHPNTTKLPGIQQLFQSHSLAKAHKNKTQALPSPSPSVTPPISHYVSTPSPQHLRIPTPVGTSPSPRDLSQLFAGLPPPPPYPGNPNLGSPSSLDMPRSPAESTESGGLPIVYWDDELERKVNSLQWQTDPDSLFHELSSTGFGSL